MTNPNQSATGAVKPGDIFAGLTLCEIPTRFSREELARGVVVRLISYSSDELVVEEYTGRRRRLSSAQLCRLFKDLPAQKWYAIRRVGEQVSRAGRRYGVYQVWEVVDGLSTQ